MLLFKGPVRGAFCAHTRHGFRGFDWEVCYNSRPFIFNAGSLTLSVDSAAFSFLLFFHFICMLVFVYFIFYFVFLLGLYRIVIVSRVVISDCSDVNFLLICVITPCYVVIFVMFCHLLHCKLI